MAAELVDLFNSEIDLKVRIAVAARDQDPSVHFGPHAQYETFDVAFVRASHDSEEAFFTPIGAPAVCHFLKFWEILVKNCFTQTTKNIKISSLH